MADRCEGYSYDYTEGVLIKEGKTSIVVVVCNDVVVVDDVVDDVVVVVTTIPTSYFCLVLVNPITG